jgi:hypothetical protein
MRAKLLKITPRSGAGMPLPFSAKSTVPTPPQARAV